MQMNPFLDSALSLRRRISWEAADSGILLWRSNFVYFIPFFAIPLWVAACGLRLLLPESNLLLPYLILWWLRPLFERSALHVVSRRFISGTGRLRRGIWGSLSRGLLGDLLWRRFSLQRAVNTPIRVLEGLGPGQTRLRKKSLTAGGLGFCSYLTIFSFSLEITLLFGEIFFSAMVCYLFFPSALEFLLENIHVAEIGIFIAFCLNYLLAGSLYVCMGFGIYVNSRVETEGWDLQLLFRKFAGTAGIILLCLFLLAPAAAYAEQDDMFAPHLPAPGAHEMESLNAILASPDFGEEREGWGIRLKNTLSSDEIPDIDIVPWMEKIRQFFALTLRVLAALGIGVLAFFLLYWLRKLPLKRLSGFFANDSYSNPLMAAESPDALFAKAESCFQRGKLREAWAACLAGCLGAFTERRSLIFPSNATEYGCLSLVRRALPAEALNFESLVRNWILFAYGGIKPAEGAFEQALAYGRALAVSGEAQ